jgi:phosphosulfolactate phosphohydrolase-like enzyme
MQKEVIYKRPAPATVIDVMKSLKVVGMGTPSIARSKCKMLFQPDFVGNKIAVVMIDVIRCTSTILACFGAGVESVTITVKGEADKGTTLEQSKRVSEIQNCELAIGGELKGLPIAGGIIGNSPSEAANCSQLANKHLHFESSNFGKTFSEVTKSIYEYKAIGGDATLFVGSYSNAKSIAAVLKNNQYDKIYIVCGGFYDGITLEDEIAAGVIINELEVGFNEIDDEARTMLLLFQIYNTFEKQYEVLSSNSVSKLLAMFDKQDDIKTVLNGDGIPLEIWKLMCEITPYVSWIENTPVIISDNNNQKAKYE